MHAQTTARSDRMRKRPSTTALLYKSPTYDEGKKGYPEALSEVCFLRGPQSIRCGLFPSKANVTGTWGNASKSDAPPARLCNGFVHAACKRGTAPATCEKRDKWRGSPSTACVPCRATGPQRLYLPLPLAPRAASAAFAWSARTTRLWLSRQQSLQ